MDLVTIELRLINKLNRQGGKANVSNMMDRYDAYYKNGLISEKQLGMLQNAASNLKQIPTAPPLGAGRRRRRSKRKKRGSKRKRRRTRSKKRRRTRRRSKK